MSDLLSIPALEEDELAFLGQFLETQTEQQESFDFFEAHGFLTAIHTGPVAADWDEIHQVLFPEGAKGDSDDIQQAQALLKKLSLEIQAWLDSGQDFPVPCELTLEVDDEDEESAAVEAWSAGFIAAVLRWDEHWYAKQEDQVAEYLFPIMYASGLFADEPDMADIDEDLNLSNQMCNNIPPAVVELFLHYHAAKG